MQFIPYQEPEWQKSLTGLIGTLGTQGSKIVGSHFEAKNRKELEKREKERKEQERSNLANAYAQTGGMSYEQAYALANTPPDIQKAIVQQMLDRGVFGPGREMGQRGMGAQGQMQPGMPQSPLSSLQGLSSPQQEQVPYGGLTMSNMAQSLRPEDPGAFLAQRALQGTAAGINPMRPAQFAPQVQRQAASAKELDSQISQAIRDYDINQGLDMNPTNISGMLSMGLSKDEAKRAISDAADYDRKLKDEVKGGKELMRITNDMMGIIEKDIKSGGKLLRGPGTQTLLNAVEGGHGKGLAAGIGGVLGAIAGSVLPGAGTLAGAGLGSAIGGGLGALGATAIEAGVKANATKETQEFEKHSAEFVKGAKNVFGSRITDADLNAFMKMVPTLSNTNEGKLAVLRNIQLVNEATLVKGKVRDKIVKENGGRRPFNLEDMVEEISAPLIDSMADQFKKDTEEMFARYNTPAEQPQKKSLIPGLPGSYNANEL